MEKGLGFPPPGLLAGKTLQPLPLVGGAPLPVLPAALLTPPPAGLGALRVPLGEETLVIPVLPLLPLGPGASCKILIAHLLKKSTL